MSIEAVTDITTETLFVIIKTAAPLLLISLCVGLVVSIFQTVTSIQEQTLTFVPKVLAIFVGIMILGHWMLNNMITFMTNLWADFTLYIR
ncbi:flagellar biosynthetic protein FliQ [bacterium C-53]|nr:flagellar biosynthetic protein FliQ [Lachnospiraceae bacterium]NBI02127.1 flagellar biosynthetic protein FliQ [Lachnospiraceae bacterium]RKJ10387.1 flagellar biosynthetic protein FliQ [bacterium C-53]